MSRFTRRSALPLLCLAGVAALGAPPKIAKQIDDDRDLQRAVARTNGRLRNVPPDSEQQPVVFDLPWYNVDLKIDLVSATDADHTVDVCATFTTLRLADSAYVLPAERRFLDDLERAARHTEKRRKEMGVKVDPDDPKIHQETQYLADQRNALKAAIKARRQAHTACTVVVHCPGTPDDWNKRVRIRGVVRILAWREADFPLDSIVDLTKIRSVEREADARVARSRDLKLPRSVVRVEAQWLGEDPPAEP